MKFEMLANRVVLTVRLRMETGRTLDDVWLRMEVDEYGHVELDLPYRRGESGHERQKRYREKLDVLMEELQVAEWRAIGPEDSEPFLTDEWMERTKGLRAVIGAGWIELPLPEGIEPVAPPQPAPPVAHLVGAACVDDRHPDCADEACRCPCHGPHQ